MKKRLLGYVLILGLLLSSPLRAFISPDPEGHVASMDLYSYCNGDPVNQYDPDGRFFGEDDAVVFGVGAIIGAGAHGLSDLAHGQFTGWPGYGRAFLAGGVGAEVTYLTAPVLLQGAFGAGGAAAGFTENFLKQINTISRVSGYKSNSISWLEFCGS